MHQTSFLDCTPRAVEASAQAMAAPVDAGSGACSVGRPALHVNGAARLRAHRASKARIDFTDDPKIKETIADIADGLGCSEADVLRSFTRFALTNRNWKQVGLYGSKAVL